jgi:hypothetical protein
MVQHLSDGNIVQIT